MRLPSWAAMSSRLCRGALLLIFTSSLHAAAGIRIEQFGYQKNIFSDPAQNTLFIDDFDGGGPLVNSAGGFEWQVKIGAVFTDDESGGDLNLKPKLHGAPFNIGPYTVTGQVMSCKPR